MIKSIEDSIDILNEVNVKKQVGMPVPQEANI
jgi:hypothetical protein